MQLIGQNVQHKIFGAGVVTDCQDNSLTVRFSDGTKNFVFPDAFERFLKIEGDHNQKKIRDILEKKKEDRQEHIQALQEKQCREVMLSELKITPISQGAFDIPEDEDPFADWSVSTGVYLSGYGKGMPRTPDRMRPNSMCLLTSCAHNGKEADRQIIGMFMVEDEFLGTECRDGVISAHPDYRLRLDEPIPFWQYITNDRSKYRWGRVNFKYISNNVVEAILFDVYDRLRDTEDHEKSEKFYRYYCKMNRIVPRQTD